MKALCVFLLSAAAMGQSFPRDGALASTSVPGGGIIFSPAGATTGTTRFVGLSYPTVPTDTLLFTLGILCTPSSCPAGGSVMSPASAHYTGPNCIPTSSCSSGSSGFGSAIKATTGTTINAQVGQGISVQQNNLSTTSLPASWFSTHWKMITPNKLTSSGGVLSGVVAVPTTGTCGAGSCAGNVLLNGQTTSQASKVCYLTVTSPAVGCTGGGVGTKGSVVSAWAIPNATAPVTPPIDPQTGVAAKATYLGFTSSSQTQTSYGDPQFLFTETGESSQSCANLASVFCTTVDEDFWILADGGPVAAWEADMQIWDSTGAWTFALQCRIHSASGTLVGWGQGDQKIFPPKHIAGTTAANCPSATQWLHVMYHGIRTQNVGTPSAGTFTILSLTLQSAPGGPAGATGYVNFPVNVTYTVDTNTSGNSCTNQMQIDQWCAAGGACSSTQYAGAYYALNNVTCGTGTAVTPISTQLYN